MYGCARHRAIGRAMRDIARLNGFFTGRRANKTNTARNAFRRRGDTVCTLRQPDSRALLNHTYLCPVDKNFTKLGTINRREQPLSTRTPRRGII